MECCKYNTINSAIESQQLKLNVEKKLLNSVQNSKFEKKIQTGYLLLIRIIKFFYQIITTKNIALYKFKEKNIQQQTVIGTFNYGTQNLGFYGFYPEPEILNLDKIQYTLTVKQKINLLKRVINRNHIPIYHELQSSLLWESYNGVRYDFFAVVEGNDFVTKVLLDIMHFNGSTIQIVHYAPYLGHPYPNRFLNLVNNQKNFEAHKFVSNKVMKLPFPSCVNDLGVREPRQKYISFFSTTPHVTMPEKLIIEENELVMRAVQDMNISLKLSLHPQFRKNSEKIKLMKNCKFRNYEASFDNFLLDSELVISQWSTVVIQAAYVGKKVILLDFERHGLLDLLSEETAKNVQVAYTFDHLRSLLKDAIWGAPKLESKPSFASTAAQVSLTTPVNLLEIQMSG